MVSCDCKTTELSFTANKALEFHVIVQTKHLKRKAETDDNDTLVVMVSKKG